MSWKSHRHSHTILLSCAGNRINLRDTEGTLKFTWIMFVLYCHHLFIQTENKSRFWWITRKNEFQKHDGHDWII